MILLAVLLAVAPAAEAAPTPAAPPAASADKAPDPDKEVCRKGVNQTGSRMKQRPVCMTRREWAERERLDKEMMAGIQRGSTASERRAGSPQ